MNLKSNFTFAAVMLAGAAVGSALTTALRAQSAPPAYVVAEVAVHDAMPSPEITLRG